MDAVEEGRPTIECIAKEETPDGPEPAPQIRIFTARFRDGRAELGIGQRTKDRKRGSDNPRGKDDRDKTAFPGHFGGFQENASSNHRAHDNGARCPRSEPAHEFQAFFRG